MDEGHHSGCITHSEKSTLNTIATSSKAEDISQYCSEQPVLTDLPKEILMKIIQYLPTVSLIACTNVHEVLTSLIMDIQFLNAHTRFVLGFPANQKDITYDTVPTPAAPLQNLWYQVYLHRSAPKMVGLVHPGVVFYDLLCFKHLLDTWILQGLGYKYWMFVADVLKNSQPPLSFLKCKRLVKISKHMMQILTQVALCSPQILLLTVNDFEALSISSSPPSELDNVWASCIPSEWKFESALQHTCEVVSRQRGLMLASFFLAFDAHNVIGWCGVIDYSTFRWKDTWGLCQMSRDASLNEIRKLCQMLFPRFIEYVGNDYISVKCPNAFLFQGLGKLIKQRETLLPQMQEALERNALNICRKLHKFLSQAECRDLKIFLDRVPFLVCDGEETAAPTSSKKTLPHCELSKTLEVAVQRYLHRYLNQMIGKQVLNFYTDSVCHHVLCITCRNSHSIVASPVCVSMDRIGPQRIPLKIWPPHLMHFAMGALPALAKLVRLDVVLWKQGLCDQPLSEKVASFIRNTLTVVYLDFVIDPCKTGIIANRILM